MKDQEYTWDKLLKIKTTGRDDSNSDQYRFPYEPTPYSVLERLANSGLIRKKDSYYAEPRELLLFFYYPSEEYLSYLMTVDELEFYDEIDCSDLFETNDPREQIMIFSLGM